MFLFVVGLTLEQATNVETLKSELEKLDRQFRELSIGSRTRYLPREDRDKLKAELSNRAAERDRLQLDVERLRRLESLMRVAAESAQFYLKIQLPHQTIGDAILLALTRAAAEANEDQKGDFFLIKTKIAAVSSCKVLIYLGGCELL